MDFIDITALADSTIVSADNVEFGDLSLFQEKGNLPVYGTMELNRFVLDGTRQILPVTGKKAAFWSKDMSDERCVFVRPPKVTVNFSKVHSSIGIKLYFAEEAPGKIRITWYDLWGNAMKKNVFEPDSAEYFCGMQVEDYAGLTVEFLESAFPYRYVEYYYNEYGAQIEWGADTITEANVVEEIDVTGATLAVNKAELSIVDTDNNFELWNKDGNWKYIQNGQKMRISEWIDNEEIPIGSFYIQNWSNSKNIVKFNLADRIGMLDKTRFCEGRIYESESAGDIIDAIMLSAGVEQYTISDEVREMRLTGYLPIGTHRQALQQVVFACGAVADCGRSDSIEVVLPDRYVSSTIGTDRKFLGTIMSLEEYVSGVAIEYQKYKLSEETKEIFDGELPAGKNRIEFSEPYSNVTVSAGSIVERKTNYIVVNMEQAGTCLISGRIWESNAITYVENLPFIAAGEQENVITFAGCTLYTMERVKELAQRLLRYYQLRQRLEIQVLLGKEQAGAWCNIRDEHGNTATTGIVSQSIDLTGGFIAKTVCKGYAHITTEYEYTGEKYCGERMGVI